MFQTPNWENDVPDTKFSFSDSKKLKVLAKKGKKNVDQKKISVNIEKTEQIVQKQNHKKKTDLKLSQRTNIIKKNKPRKNVTLSNKTSNNSRKSNNSLEKKYVKNISPIKNNSFTRSNSPTTMNFNNKGSNISQKQSIISPEKRIAKNKSLMKINSKTKSNGPTTAEDNNLKKAKKRKHSEQAVVSPKISTKIEKNKLKSKKNKVDNIYNTDDLDEVLIQAKKRKLEKKYKNQNKEESLFQETCKPKGFFKKQQLQQLLEFNRNKIKTNGNKLRERMLEKLKSAQFRYLNEKLYTSSGNDAQELFSSDPDAFHTYHQGYRQQLKKWPVNPLDVIVKRIQKLPKSMLIADMGCGEAKLSKRIQHTVRSFDLVATAPDVEVCNMAHTPLLTGSMDVAVYCLALMGTELTQYLVEANRILKTGGLLLIAEVESRFDDVTKFTDDIQRLGFKLIKLDKTHDVFFFMEFKKIQDPPAKQAKRPVLYLKPCLYKRR